MKRRLLIFALVVITVTAANGQKNYLDKRNALLNEGDFNRAEKVFRQGIKNNPNDLILKCQLGLTLIEKEKFDDAELVLDEVLKIDSDNIGAHWYSGIGNFKNAKDRKAVEHFEKVIPMLDQSSGQYYSANWFIGKSYSNLLKTEGLTFTETDRMIACYEEYLRLQPNAQDSKAIREYVDRKKKRRPGDNVLKWIDL